mmetsp:Transcript_18208/g.53049  ORF Transcript_18208/g.53049 Transcript_18208/m.53049 type:complete len:347 (+) Transcript_18208:1209-2249(+)
MQASSHGISRKMTLRTSPTRGDSSFRAPSARVSANSWTQGPSTSNKSGRRSLISSRTRNSSQRCRILFSSASRQALTTSPKPIPRTSPPSNSASVSSAAPGPTSYRGTRQAAATTRTRKCSRVLSLWTTSTPTSFTRRSPTQLLTTRERAPVFVTDGAIVRGRTHASSLSRADCAAFKDVILYCFYTKFQDSSLLEGLDKTVFGPGGGAEAGLEPVEGRHRQATNPRGAGNAAGAGVGGAAALTNLTYAITAASEKFANAIANILAQGTGHAGIGHAARVQTTHAARVHSLAQTHSVRMRLWMDLVMSRDALVASTDPALVDELIQEQFEMVRKAAAELKEARQDH